MQVFKLTWRESAKNKKTISKLRTLMYATEESAQRAKREIEENETTEGTVTIEKTTI
jgi:hypothetical protein